MTPKLFGQAVETLVGSAAQLKLATRLERNVAGASLKGQDPSGLETGLPTEPLGKAAQDLFHPVGSAERQGPACRRVDAEFLEFTADPPGLSGLEGFGEERGKFFSGADEGARHGSLPVILGVKGSLL